MPRGSRPGERRGGRQRGTPNKKTLIKNAVFLAAASEPNRSPLDFMLALMRDLQVPLNLRIDVAATAAPFVHARPEPVRNRRPDPLDLRDWLGDSGDLRFERLEAKPAGLEGGSLSPLDFLLGVMRDPTATPRQRVKAAGVAARYKHAVAAAGPQATPTMIVAEDKFGFKVEPELAGAERDDMRREQMLHENWYRREKGSDEEKAANRELEQIRKRRTERLALLKYPPAYTADDVKKDYKRLEQLSRTRAERKKLTPEEDAEEAHLAVRVTSYDLNPAVLAEPRMRDLEERRAVGFELSSAEEAELKDLRGRYPEFAAEIDQLDLRYIYYFKREFDRATKAGLDRSAAFEQAENVCLRLRDPKKFANEFDAQMAWFRRRKLTAK